MKKRACFLVGLGFALVLFFLTASAGTSILCVDPGAGEAAKLPARMGTSQHLSAMEGRPAERLSAQGVLEYSCPLTTTTSPVWWDIPPQSGSVVVSSSGEEFIQPGPDDEVRVIIQLEGEPVSAYKSRLKAVPAPLTNAESDQIRDYASELRRSHQQLVSKIKAQGIQLEVRREYSYIFNGLAASIKMADMKRIETLPGVKGVYPDYEVHALLDESVPLIGAPAVWAMTDANGQSVTGRGIHVAVIDTGIDYTHPDLGGCLGSGCKVVGGYDFVNDDADPWDDNGHGTHVAGIVAANGTVKGVAPEATLYAYKALNQNGYGHGSDIIAAIERSADPDGDPITDDAVDVINMSLGGLGDPNEPLALAVDAAVDQGVIVAVAAGNSGPGYETISSPGVARKAFTVGATEKDDHIADLSSRGPVAGFYELIKPDIVAPGVSINSTFPGGHTPMDGTSMSAPHIAGAAALIKQLHPTWTPELIKANLMNTAKDLGVNVYTQGAGRVRLDVAATTQTALTPASVGFGVVDADEPVWTRNERLQLTNTGTNPANYTIDVTDNLPVGITATVDPSNVTLAAGESAMIDLEVSVDNTVVPYPTEQPGAYESRVVVQSADDRVEVPFALHRMARLELSFGGYENPVVWVHDGTQTVAVYVGAPSSLTLLVSPGTYDVATMYGKGIVIHEGIMVDGVTVLDIRPEQAVNEYRIAPRDVDGNVMQPGHGRFAHRLVHAPSGMLFTGGRTLGNLGQSEPIGWPMLFSDFSESYVWEWRLGTTWKGSTYEFHDRVAGLDSSRTYSNTPEELRSIQHRCHPGDGISQVGLRLYSVESSACGLPWHESPTLELLHDAPFVQNSYYVPYHAEFSFPYVYLEAVDVANGDVLFLSPYYLFKASGEIEAFVPESSEMLAILPGDKLHLGQSPPHWFGKFSNDATTIRIEPVVSQSEALFLNQGEDRCAHGDLPYQVYQGGSVVADGHLPAASAPLEWVPATDIALGASGVYSVEIIYDKYQVGANPGQASVVASFDTSSGDKDPPTLLGLQVLHDGKMTNRVVPAAVAQVQFRTSDAGGLDQVSLLYSLGSAWTAVPLAVDGDQYTGQLPGFADGSLVSLRIVAQDVAGNTLSHEVSPAFEVGLSAPLLVSPSDGWATADHDIDFSWEPIDGTTSYRIQVDAVGTFDSPALIDDTAPGTSYAATLPGGTWHWQVMSKDGAGNESGFSPAQRFSVTAEVTAIASGPGPRRYPDIMRAADGTLWLVWQNGWELWYAISADEGLTWSPDALLTSDASPHGRPALGQMHDGTIWVVYVCGLDICYKTSEDDGATWSDRVNLTTDSGEYNAPDIWETDGGTLWIVFGTIDADTGGRIILRKTSVNGGATWSAASELLPDESEDAAVLQAQDGTIWLVWKASGFLEPDGSWQASIDHNIWYQSSTDGGSTWTPATRLTVDSSENHHASVAQTGDGTLWIVWEAYEESYQSGNADIWYKQSFDGGATWSAAHQWTSFRGRDEYASVVALSGDRLGLAWQSDRRDGIDDIFFGVFGEREDVDAPPYVSSIGHQTSPSPQAGEPVVLHAHARDEMGVSQVDLVWEVNGASRPDALMFDDGLHSDGDSDDGWYAVQQGPFNAGKQIRYTARATDSDGNTYTYPIEQSFQTIDPFVQTEGVLLVIDCRYTCTFDSIAPYYTDALDALGYAYDVWDSALRGAPIAATLGLYADGVVIWAAPSWSSYFVDPAVWPAVEAYRDAGGSLFVTGMSISYEIKGTDLLRQYLHAICTWNDTGIDVLTGEPDDVIGDGLNLVVSGGDGADNQTSHFEIDPISPAVAVFVYGPAGPNALGKPVRPEAARLERESRELGAVPIDVRDEAKKPHDEFAQTEEAASPAGMISSGTAGLRVDTGTYKVVYFAFGFEGINSQADRNIVMERVLAWLGAYRYSLYDFDTDCEISVTDIMAVASRWRCQFGDDCYDPLYDLDDDGDIDIVDIMVVASRWGCRCGDDCYYGTAEAISQVEPRPLMGPAAVQVKPDSSMVAPSETFTVAVEIEGAVDLGGFQFAMSFDPAVIRVEDVTLGDFLGSTGRSVSALGPEMDNDAGTMRFGAFSFGSQPGASGDGVLAILTLTAQGTGSSPLALESVQVADTGGQAQTVMVEGGRVMVAGPLRIYLPLTVGQ